MTVEDDVKRRIRAIQRVEGWSGPVTMTITRMAQAKLNRGEKIMPSEQNLIDLFNAQVEEEMKHTVASDLKAALPVLGIRLLAGVVLFIAAVYVTLRILRAIGATP